MTLDELKAIKERAEAALVHPDEEWRAEQISDGYAVQRLSRGEYRSDDEWVNIFRYDMRNRASIAGRGQAEFIAAACSDVPALIAEVERLRAVLRDTIAAAESANRTDETCAALSRARDAIGDVR